MAYYTYFYVYLLFHALFISTEYIFLLGNKCVTRSVKYSKLVSPNQIRKYSKVQVSKCHSYYDVICPAAKLALDK